MTIALSEPPLTTTRHDTGGRRHLDAVYKLPQRGTRLVIALALSAAVTLAGVLARPNPPSLSMVVTGDTALAERVRPLLPGALDRVSIAVVDGSTVTDANFGADEHTQYEIGSITKTFTGLLLADAIQRGEVTADTQVGALLPLGGAPIADVTLEELASHRSGLSGTSPAARSVAATCCTSVSSRAISIATWLATS